LAFHRSISNTEHLSVSEELQDHQQKGCKVFFSGAVDNHGQPLHEISQKKIKKMLDKPTML
jgi:hypothetical protein